MTRILRVILFAATLALLSWLWAPAGIKTISRSKPVSFNEWCVQEDTRYPRVSRKLSGSSAAHLASLLKEDDAEPQSDTGWTNRSGKIASRCIAQGAGSVQVNAIYGRTGTDATGHPRFYSQTGLVSLGYNGADDRWELIDDETTRILYVNVSQSAAPPSRGWYELDGSTPAPIITVEYRKPLRPRTKNKPTPTLARRSKRSRST